MIHEVIGVNVITVVKICCQGSNFKLVIVCSKVLNNDMQFVSLLLSKSNLLCYFITFDTENYYGW